MIQDCSDNVSHFSLNFFVFLIGIKPATRNGVLRSSDILCLHIKLEVACYSGNTFQGDYLKKRK
jgi:hypothetical protein